MSEDRDFDFEPLPGLPAPLPEGERLIWRGSPDPIQLAVRAFRLPIVGGYFVALAGWQLAGAMHEGASMAEIANRLSWTGGLALAALAILGGLGWVMAKNTVYTVTSRRVIFRHGVAMPMAINVPFTKIDGADVKVYADGTADIPLTLSADTSIARLLIWPSTRPFSYAKAHPTLRAVPDGARVARLLAQTLAEAAETSAGSVSGSVPAITTSGVRPARSAEARSPSSHGLTATTAGAA